MKTYLLSLVMDVMCAATHSYDFLDILTSMTPQEKNNFENDGNARNAMCILIREIVYKSVKM